MACPFDWITEHATVLATIASAGATIAIAWFTTRLADATRGQLARLEESIQVARDEFLSSHRPELKIHSIRLLPFDASEAPDKQPLRAEFGVINAGTSAATVTGSAVYLEYLYELDRPFPPYQVRNDVIRPRRYGVGATDTILVTSDEWGGLNHLGWEETGKILYFSGWVVYEEDRGNTRTTFFCRQYLPERERFGPVEDPDCEQTY